METVMNLRACLEVVSLAVTKGWHDGEAGASARRGKTLAKEILGPVYGPNDAEMLRQAYSFGYGCGADERVEEEGDD